jgi:ribosomal-protein-alanine N-acetyltransferase
MSDAEDLFECVSDAEVSKYTFWDTHDSIADTREFLSRLIADNAACWGIVQRKDEKLIGNCMLHSFEAQHRRAEIAFNITRQYWGHGYATEVVREVIVFSFRNWELNRIGGTCMTENLASARVLEKVGMTFEGILRKYAYTKGAFRDLRLHSILEDEI